MHALCSHSAHLLHLVGTSKLCPGMKSPVPTVNDSISKPGLIAHLNTFQVSRYQLKNKHNYTNKIIPNFFFNFCHRDTVIKTYLLQTAFCSSEEIFTFVLLKYHFRCSSVRAPAVGSIALCRDRHSGLETKTSKDTLNEMFLNFMFS